MCGISGFVSPQFSKADLERMTSAMHHRGPDAAGYYFNETDGVGLGHRRLSIIDLSEAANQPFYSSSQRYVMVFNGEVYNFQDLKAKHQLSTRTSSDTEIVMLLFEKLGFDCFNEFNGMFAIAIWDKQTNKLILARDRVGKKPLYYTYEDGTLSFASELKSLMALKHRKPDYSQLPLYLHLGYLPSPFTFYQQTKKLPAGNILIFDQGNIEIKSYWKIEPHIHNNQYITEDKAQNELERLIESSVAYRLIADVPLGSFLSGGIDSSLVTAIAQKQKSSAIKTFSIGFKESKFNESEYAKRVADHLKTDHHEFILSSDEAKSKVVSLLNIYDEPYTDSSAIPTLLVSEMARKYVTVALSGDGGDELFMGYGMYDWADRLNQFPFKPFHNLMSFGFEHFGNSRLKRIGELLKYSSKEYIPAHIFSQEQYLFTEKEIRAMLVQAPSRSLFNDSIFGMDKLPDNLSASEIQSVFDLKNYLQEDLMVKVDRATMFHSLEARSPLLDYRLVEFAYSLPKKWRKKDKTAKYLLKQLLYKHAPESLFNRPKWGFSIPLGDWLKNDLNFLIKEFLHDDVVFRFQVIHPSTVKQLIKRFNAGEDFLYNRIWALILLHQWLLKIDAQD